jgi:uncharacterized membrane protein YdjX (TVP38/TMEM64 family)
MNKNFKLTLGSIYLFCLAILLFILFSYLDMKDLTDYSFIRDKGQLLINFKNDNFLGFSLLFIIASVIWVLLLGFGSPIAILAGFIFGKWYGTFFSVLSFTIGSSLLYLLARYYFESFITKILSKTIHKYKNLFNKNEFLYFMIFRFTGGAGIPFAIQNVLPVVFNMKIKNYIYATFLGLVPTVFVINSLGEGIENLIENNKNIDYKNIFTDPGIYVPLIGFLIILLISYFIKKKIFKK